MTDNLIRIAGELVGREALRYTPARVPVLTLRLAHRSRQMEAGSERDVVCEVEARVVGAIAHQMNALPAGVIVRIEGFIAVRNARSNIPVLHVRTFELLEGNQNGI